MKLIDKAAVVARIEEGIKEYSKLKKEYPTCEEYYEGALDVLEDFKDKFLNTLEVKEVDLEEEDVFIEKAIGWIDYNNRNGGCFFDGWEKDFKKYMKGE